MNLKTTLYLVSISSFLILVQWLIFMVIWQHYDILIVTFIFSIISNEHESKQFNILGITVTNNLLEQVVVREFDLEKR